MAYKKAAKIEPASEPAEAPAPEAAKSYDWRDPDATFADDDTSLDAELWRMAQRQEGKR